MLRTQVHTLHRLPLALLFTAACSGAGNDDLGQSLGADDIDAAAPREDAAPSEPEPDAGSDVDAGEPVLDAAAPDGGALDGGEPDAGQPALTVRVRRGLTRAVPGAIVVLHDALGAVLGEPLTTGDTGEATSEERPAFVTVLPPQPGLDTDPSSSGGSVELFTYAGVAEGDTLTVELPLARGDLDAEITSYYDVTLPTPLPEGAYGVTLVDPEQACLYGSFSPLSQVDGPIEVLVAPECSEPPYADTLVAVTTDEAGQDPWFTWSSALAAPLAPGRVAAALERGWVEGAPKLLRLTGYDPSNDGASGRIAMLLESGRTVDAAFVDNAYDLVNGVAYEVAPGLGDALHAEVDLYGGVAVSAELSVSRRGVVARRIAPDGEATIDYASFLAVPHSARLEEGEAFLRPTFTFTPPAELAGIDALIGHVHIMFGSGNLRRTARWSFMLPPDATQMVLPALPAELGELVGASASDDGFLNRLVGIAAVGDEPSADFDAFRARPVRLVGGDAYLDALPVRVDVSDCDLFAISWWFEPLG